MKKTGIILIMQAFLLGAIGCEETETHVGFEDNGQVGSVVEVESDLTSTMNRIRDDYMAIEPDVLARVDPEAASSDDIAISRLAKIAGVEQIDEVQEGRMGKERVSRHIKKHPLTRKLFEELMLGDETSADSRAADEEAFKVMRKRADFRQTIKKNHFTGRVVYIDNRLRQKGTMMSDEAARAAAMKLFQELGLPAQEIDRVEVTRGVTDLLQDGELLSTRHTETTVQIARKMNGLRVGPSKFLVRFGPQEQLQKIEANWRSFRYPTNARNRDWRDIEKELVKVLKDVADVDAVEHKFIYDRVDDEQEMVFAPVLLLKMPGTFEADGIGVTGIVEEVRLWER